MYKSGLLRAHFGNFHRIIRLALLGGILSNPGCGGPVKESSVLTVRPEKSVKTESKEDATGATSDSIPACEIRINDERTNVVFSKQNDWFLTVTKRGNVDCQNDADIVRIDMAGIHINLTVYPLSSKLDFEQAMQLLIEGYATGVSRGVVFDPPLTFEEVSVGENGRRALISDGRFEQDGQFMHLLTSVTGVVNSNNHAVFHVVFWKLEESDLKKNAQLARDTIATVSSSWFRLSDVDQFGKIVNNW